MRKLILTFVLCTLSFCAFSQEAFYIYRNDGKFNGFFYDEVIEMRYSKVGVDLVESDAFVTCEVVLADTTYRIPLAAIDSIGFQQPEIKFNPRVKFMEQEGLCQYVVYGYDGGVDFQDLPAHLVPQVGDVLIGLHDDDIAKEKYYEGSFSCVVEEIIDNGGGSITAAGHPVTQLSDVFEQFITVEQIGVTKDGQVIRRMAGCTPEGMPRSKVKTASKYADLSLIDFEGNITRTWNPTEKSAIELSATIGIILKLRAAYNISWTRFMASVSQDFILKVKPALSMSVSSGFDINSDEIAAINEIGIPSTPSVFVVHPAPELFLRGEGKLEAKLNLPKVQLGIGQDFSIDTGDWFPIQCGLGLIPDDDLGFSQDMLDLSGQVTLSGYVQTGLKFSGDISTTNWIKKIFSSSIGTYLYAGPKISGEFKVSTNIPTEEGEKWAPTNAYESMEQSQLNVALISLDLEAKAAMSVFGKEGTKKFFDKNWSFLTDTVLLTPRIKSLEAIVAEDNTGVRLNLNVDPGHTLGYCWVEIGLFKGGIPTALQEPEKRIGYFDLTRVTKEQAEIGFSEVCPYDGLKAQSYYAVPIVHVGGVGEFLLDSRGAGFKPPYTLEVLTPSIRFGAKTNLKQMISIKTNAPKEDILFEGGMRSDWMHMDSVITVDEKQGMYNIVVKAEKNLTFFDRSETPKTEPNTTAVRLLGEAGDQIAPIKAYQEAPDLSDISVSAQAYWREDGEIRYGISIMRRDEVTASRQGDDKVAVEGTWTQDYDEGDHKVAYTFTVNLLVERTNEYGEDTYQIRKRICGGQVKMHTVNTYYDSSTLQWRTGYIEDTDTHFTNAEGWQREDEGESFSGTLSSGSYDLDTYYDEHNKHIHTSMSPDQTSEVSIGLFVK